MKRPSSFPDLGSSVRLLLLDRRRGFDLRTLVDARIGTDPVLLHEARELVTSLHKFIERSSFDDATILHHYDGICAWQEMQRVRDEDPCLVFENPDDSLGKKMSSDVRVNLSKYRDQRTQSMEASGGELSYRREGIVEQDDVRIVIECPSNRDSLLLAS